MESTVTNKSFLRSWILVVCVALIVRAAGNIFLPSISYWLIVEPFKYLIHSLLQGRLFLFATILRYYVVFFAMIPSKSLLPFPKKLTTFLGEAYYLFFESGTRVNSRGTFLPRARAAPQRG